MTQEENKFTIWHGLLLAEFTAVLISLAMVISPGKTGSGRGIAHHFFPEPTFWQEFLVNFILTNILFLVIGIAIALWIWQKGSK